TMNHSARLNEKMARLPGFSDVHPLQPQSTVQGAIGVMQELSHWLLTLTGMKALTLAPAAGAHGEFCGMAAIKSALRARGEDRKVVLVPESAHGTNPATAAALGFTVVTIPANARGRVDRDALIAKLDNNVAAIMLTNPNTCGLFESEIVEIADAVHKVGAYFYGDGANYNAIVGRVRPADLGIDAMHINLHKTFSTPHGGGGPGSGPVVFSERLAAYVPLPYIKVEAGKLSLVETATPADTTVKPFGRLKAFHGQMGMFTRALSYILSHGADGLYQVASDSVLNANYILASLKDVMSAPFDGPCMHEALFDDSFLKDTGITTLDIAKALLDRGYHPMTMYFPLVVHGAFLIEPTETESKRTLDAYIAVMRELAIAAKDASKKDMFLNAPTTTPRRRLDETRAARQPVLRWKKV
ncbi:MAG: aminomethyl-transferring glycine dehydrogenase subunit GcvPB, partial [Alphaproteobacteria bacterium]|nr:aminomethyl-transferring glycine dehydrogenase subunit GcvPB [Alphaproteobacteria bacterium]